jgi:hypothetical protein
MEITRSSKISEELSLLAGRKQLKLAKKLAVWSTCTSRISYVEDFAKTLCSRYGGNFPDLISGVAGSSQTTLYFEGTEEEVLEKLRAIKTPSKGKTAPKVIVKMIYTRLVQLQARIDSMKEQLSHQDGASFMKNWKVPTLTREMLTSQLDFNHIEVPWGVVETARDLASLFSRDDFTDKLIDEAWHLFQLDVTVMNA